MLLIANTKSHRYSPLNTFVLKPVHPKKSFFFQLNAKYFLVHVKYSQFKYLKNIIYHVKGIIEVIMNRWSMKFSRFQVLNSRLETVSDRKKNNFQSKQILISSFQSGFMSFKRHLGNNMWWHNTFSYVTAGSERPATLFFLPLILRLVPSTGCPISHSFLVIHGLSFSVCGQASKVRIKASYLLT